MFFALQSRLPALFRFRCSMPPRAAALRSRSASHASSSAPAALRSTSSAAPSSKSEVVLLSATSPPQVPHPQPLSLRTLPPTPTPTPIPTPTPVPPAMLLAPHPRNPITCHARYLLVMCMLMWTSAAYMSTSRSLVRLRRGPWASTRTLANPRDLHCLFTSLWRVPAVHWRSQ